MSQFPIHGGPLKTDCERTGEHTGEPVIHVRDTDAYEVWDCCGDEDHMGEVFTCDACGKQTVTTDSVPDGWVEYDDGFHCLGLDRPDDI